ncbi:MAG: hypothetical protein DIU54_001360 [Acidobacteriota bacterium]|nr:MAG: hypothetical protein DIU54_01270 [Acidobacteriota bacterium]
MKKLLKIVVVAGLALSLASPALAQSSSTSSALSADATTSPSAQIGAGQSLPPEIGANRPSGRLLTWTGASLFVAGMGVGIYGFLNNSNGRFPEFGEADATNTRVGVAGLTTAFAGGALMFLGQRMSRYAPEVQVSANRLSVSRKVSW